VAIEHQYIRFLDGPDLEPLDRGISTEVSGAALRAPRPCEVDTLHEIYLDAFSTRTTAPLDGPTWIRKWPLHHLCVLDHSVIAFTGDTAIGYLLAYLDEDFPGEGIIGQLGVRTANRRQGVASAMVIAALRGFETLGLSCATLSVAPDNTSAIRSYEQLGFARKPSDQR